MTVLTPKPVPSSQLTWLPDVREYVGEASSTYGFGRVWDDACDEGLTLVSTKSGRQVVFAVDREVRDEDGDVRYWILSPARPQDRHLNVRIRLFND